MDVLAYLAAHTDHVVSTDELLETVWAGRVVEPATVHRRINQIRHALGDDSRSPHYILTVPKRGYRTIAAVEWVDTRLPGTADRDDGDGAIHASKTEGALHGSRRPGRLTWLGASLAPVLILFGAVIWLTRSAEPAYPLTAIAILPFDDLSPDGDQSWLGAGMAEALTLYLSRVEGLEVKQPPRHPGTALDPIALAEQLESGALVVGSVQRSGDAVSVTARYVNAADGTQLWAASYDSSLDDLFDLQHEVAREIVRAIEARLGIVDPRGPILIDQARYGTRDVRAYELYLKSFDLRFPRDGSIPDDRDLRQALYHNRKAVEIDPEYSVAWVGLGAIHGAFWGQYRDIRDRQEMVRALERAVELDPANPIALAALMSASVGQGRWEKVIRLAQQADSMLRLAQIGNGGSIAAYLGSLANLGRWEEAEAVLDDIVREVARHPERFPPEHPFHVHIAVMLAGLLRDHDAAIERMERYTRARPTPETPQAVAAIYGAWHGGRYALARAYRARGWDAEALDLYLFGVSDADWMAIQQRYESGSEWEEMLRDIVSIRRRAGNRCRGLIEMYAELGESEQMYDCLEQSAVRACLDSKPEDRAYQCFENGADLPSLPLWMAASFDAYRDEERFQAVLDSAGVVGYENCCPRRSRNL